MMLDPRFDGKMQKAGEHPEINTISYGGGTNSTAMLVGMWERGIRPDYITFADTGGEKPNTYSHIEQMQKWLSERAFPEIKTVFKVYQNGERDLLEGQCLKQKTLPSIVYGFKACSARYKIAPQDKYFNSLPEIQAHWKKGGKVTKWIGYDTGESHRVKVDRTDDKYDFYHPLVEWGWDRDDCIAAIERAGLKQPGKSSCFFCPSMKYNEIRELAAVYPELAARAVEMEKNAAENMTHIKGLGRTFSWENVIATDDMFPNNYIELSCGCYDG